MTIDTFWFSELLERGKAPDFNAEFHLGPLPAGVLRDRVRKLKLSHFRHQEDKDLNLDVYVCKDDAEPYFSKSKENFSVINTFTVTDNSVSFFRGNGGHTLRDYGEDEMRLLEMLMSDKSLSLIKWRVWNSGDGLRGEMAIEGTSWEDFKK